MFSLSATSLDPAALEARLAHPRAGALATFSGWVRNHNDGHPVLALDYEAYAELAAREGERILAEIRARHDLTGLLCVHRVGSLRVGDLAVWVGAAAAHRGPAFDACRAAIDEIKARVPIWKKEHYADGAALWVNCATRGDHAAAAPPADPAKSR